MTIPCANCGTAIAADQYRCPTCDALAPVDETAVAARHETDGPAGDQTGTVPWAIPIREGARGGAPPPRRSRDPLRTAVHGLLAVALLAGLLAIAGGFLGGGGDTETASESEPDVTGEVVDDEVEIDDGPTTTSSADETTSTTTPPTSSTTSSPSTSTISTTAVPRSTTTATSPAPARPGSAPVLSSSFRGGWIAQLTSVPASTGEDAIEAAWSEARSDAAGAVVTRSDDWSSLERGFWVVVAPGPFSDADDARAYCARIPDSARTDCLPRELTGRR